MSEHRPRILVDFDGVLHSYRSGWCGVTNIPDQPVPGAIDWLCRALRDFDVAILSARSHQFGGRWAMKRWLLHRATEHFIWMEWKERASAFSSMGFIEDTMVPWDTESRNAAKFLVKRIQWPRFKVPSLLIIDDRAICFKGTFPKMSEIKNYKSWVGGDL